MPGCLLSGSISSQARRGSMRAELRCLAAGQPSRPISVEAPLWSQVVGSAYREDQQRSVSPPHSPPFRVHCLFLSLFFPIFCPLPFWHYLPPPTCFPPQINIFPSKSYHCHPSALLPSPALCLFQGTNRLTVFFPPCNPLLPKKGSSTLFLLRGGIN